MQSYIDLLDGYYLCKVCGRVSPKQSMIKHVNACDNYNVDEDLTAYDKEVTKLLDLQDVLKYHQGKKEGVTLAHRQRNNVNVMASFPDIMIKRVEEKIREQTKIVKMLDSSCNTFKELEVEEIRMIRNVVQLKRIECLTEIY